MNRTSFTSWLDSLGKAWMSLNPKGAAAICAEDVDWHEGPFDKPVKSREEVEKIWADVPESHKDVEFQYEILSVDNDLGIARWWASFTRVKTNERVTLDGIYKVRLNDSGLCKEFHQWAVSKPM